MKYEHFMMKLTKELLNFETNIVQNCPLCYFSLINAMSFLLFPAWMLLLISFVISSTFLSTCCGRPNLPILLNDVVSKNSLLSTWVTSFPHNDFESQIESETILNPPSEPTVQ